MAKRIFLGLGSAMTAVVTGLLAFAVFVLLRDGNGYHPFCRYIITITALAGLTGGLEVSAILGYLANGHAFRRCDRRALFRWSVVFFMQWIILGAGIALSKGYIGSKETFDTIRQIAAIMSLSGVVLLAINLMVGTYQHRRRMM